MPFAVVGSEKTVVVNGRNVRGRQNKWGIINGKLSIYFFLARLLTLAVEDENHCEFVFSP